MTILRTFQSAVLSIAVVATMGATFAAPQPASAATATAASRTTATATARTYHARARSTGSFAHQVLRLTNLERTRRGLRPLARARCTDRVSGAWAWTLASRRMFRHQSQRRVARACGTTYVGENIAMGNGLTPAQVVRLWMHSRGHRANILRRGYGHLGIGAYQSTRSGRIYVVQSFRA